MDDRLRIGVSSCLTGARVRFDGGHAASALVAALGRFAELVAVCPEVELGLSVPRETLRLVRRPSGDVSLVAPRSQRDHTGPMRWYAARRAEALAALDLDGFILKKGSPSCGLERVRVYSGEGVPVATQKGLFAEALVARLPLLPVEEDGRLHDPGLRERFLVRVFAHRALRGLFQPGWRRGDLVAFHTSMKLLLMAHHPEGARVAGRVVAEADALDREALAARYREAVGRTLAHLPPRGRHVNVLEHALGFLRGVASDEDRREARALVDGYARGLLPRAVPLALLRHLARRFALGWLAAQRYFAPYPLELAERASA